MLDGNVCKQINVKYKQENGHSLNGKVHGAIYYHYFGENVDICQNKKFKKQFIRGFAVYGTKYGVKYQFKSGAFNQTGLQLKDDKFRELPSSEKLFIQYSLDKFWECGENRNKTMNDDTYIATFTEFEKEKNAKTNLQTICEDVEDVQEIKTDGTKIGDVPGYIDDVLQKLVDNRISLKFSHSNRCKYMRGKTFKVLEYPNQADFLVSSTSQFYHASINDADAKGMELQRQYRIDNESVTIKQQIKAFSSNSGQRYTITSNHVSTPLLNEFMILKDIGNRYLFDLQESTYRLLDFFVENDLCHLVLPEIIKCGNGKDLVTTYPLQHIRAKYVNFSLQQVSWIVTRMISILYNIHSMGYVHNNIKPENILIHNSSNNIQLSLIDFGIASSYWDFVNDKHKACVIPTAFKGSMRFSSMNHHCNQMNQSRRDDLESLIYVSIYLRCGTLPWMHPLCDTIGVSGFKNCQSIKATM